MSNIVQYWSERPLLLIFIGIAIAVMLLVETVGRAVAGSRSNRAGINKRLKLLKDEPNRENVLMELRRDRGLNETGSFPMPFNSLNRLFVQSGAGPRGPRIAIMALTIVTAMMVAGVALFHLPLLAIPLGMLIGGAVPILAVVSMRNRRQAKFGEQLPDALDIMVRSMRAGHPVPVAISLVARELPDPIGTEFGMTGDEMTYGLDLEAALQNMCARVGQQDLPFVLVAVSIQSKTGGNLAEVLANLSRVIRERFKLRRKVQAMSAEGRWSAGALSLIPLLVFVAINLLAPSFYGNIKNDPAVMPIAVTTLMIWAMGIFIIYRLVNFRY